MANRELKENKQYKVISEISNTKQLMDAFANVYTLQDGIMDEISSEFVDELKGMLDQQKRAIEDYIGVFDYEVFKENINYLLKKYNLKIGDMESYLGISPGYISRAFNESSNKRLSIDIVWKIAKMFGTDIRTLVNTKMWEVSTTRGFISNFIDRLLEDTENNSICWLDDGGGEYHKLNPRYCDAGLTYPNRKANNRYEYLGMKDLISEEHEITDDVYYLENFDEGKDLAIIPYGRIESDMTEFYDFILVWEVPGIRTHYERFFCTEEDVLMKTNDHAEKLYKYICRTDFDMKITSKVKSRIEEYMNGGKD